MGWFTRGPGKAVRATEVAPLLAQGAVLVDVRGRDEWRAGRAPRARHIPLDELDRRSSELPAERTVITVCRSGRRSAAAASALRRKGYTVLNLSGGMQAWAAAGLPVVANGGAAGRVA